MRKFLIKSVYLMLVFLGVGLIYFDTQHKQIFNNYETLSDKQASIKSVPDQDTSKTPKVIFVEVPKQTKSWDEYVTLVIGWVSSLAGVYGLLKKTKT